MGDGGRLHPVPGTKLVEDVRGWTLAVLRADEERVGDLLVGPARGDEPQDLELALRQARGSTPTPSHATTIPARCPAAPGVLAVDLLEQGAALRAAPPSRAPRSGCPRASARSPRARSVAPAAREPRVGRRVRSPHRLPRGGDREPLRWSVAILDAGGLGPAHRRDRDVAGRRGRRHGIGCVERGGRPLHGGARSRARLTRAPRHDRGVVVPRPRRVRPRRPRDRRPVAASIASAGSRAAPAAPGRRPSAHGRRSSRSRVACTAASSAEAATMAARSSVPPIASSIARAVVKAVLAAATSPRQVASRPRWTRAHPGRPRPGHRARPSAQVAGPRRPTDRVAMAAFAAIASSRPPYVAFHRRAPRTRSQPARAATSSASAVRPTRSRSAGEVAWHRARSPRRREVLRDRLALAEPFDPLVHPTQQGQVLPRIPRAIASSDADRRLEPPRLPPRRPGSTRRIGRPSSGARRGARGSALASPTAAPSA